MPGQVLIKGYQIGYRVEGIGSYTAPYTDLPIIPVETTVSAAKYDAQRLYDKLSSDFSFAEWRIVECWE